MVCQKRTTLKLALLFVLSVFTTAFVTRAQLLSFQNFNHKDGLNFSSINCLAQSNDGYIWLGTDGAELVRFDGSSFEEIRFKSGDNNHHYSNITFDGDNILFSSLYKGFFSYSRKHNTITKLNQEKFYSGNSIGLFKKDSIYYFIGSRGINFRKNNTYGNLLTILSGENDIEILHSIKAEHSIFLFTNKESYKLSKGKITPLSSLLKVDKKNVSNFKYGFIEEGKLYLYDDQLQQILIANINEKDELSKVIIKKLKTKSAHKIVSFSYHPKLQKSIASSKNGTLYEISKSHISQIQHNYNEPIIEINEVLTDNNGDYWIGSKMKGLYKVSHELFTRIQLDPIFTNPAIYSIYETKQKDFFFSQGKKTSYFGVLNNQNSFEELSFKINSICQLNNNYLIATNEGIKLYNPLNKTFSLKYFENKEITLVFKHKDFIYAGVAQEGLFKINLKTNQINHITSPKGINYFYSAQINHSNQKIYFGTNYGAMQHNINTDKVTEVPINYKKLGGYSGTSTKDSYETCWFTLEKGILGITKNGKLKVIYGDKDLNTNLYYTLNSDQNGNLVLGTNKGISIIKVNELGEIKSIQNYGNKEGFQGYETNMRAQFQSGNLIYVGTVEGLFQINMSKLIELSIPSKPTILKSSKKNLVKVLGEKSISFTLKVNNPKSQKIIYSYRVKELSENWATTTENSIIFNELRNSSYTLEVRATYNGIDFSPVSQYYFEINSPFWKTNWFVIVLIFSIILINFIILVYFKSNDKSSLINAKDIDVHLNMTPTILIFGTIITPFALIIAPYTDPTLEYHFGIIFSLAFSMLTLYLLSLSARSRFKEHLFSLYLKIALILVLSVFFLEVYYSKLNPYYIFGIILASLLSPYIFNKIRLTLFFSIAIFCISIGITIILGTTIYPKAHFIVAIFVLSSLLIFSSHLRYDSLEKLIFISGIINKGNIPAIAFNNQGIITYASENISNFIGITHHEILNKNVSILNRFIPKGNPSKDKDITKEFKDGEKYLVPMELNPGEVKWIEWDYKDFSKDVKVILGQDISEKIDLENTYELLVQNAEDFIYRCDAFGNYTFINDVSFRKLGYTKEDLIGVNSLKLVHDDYRNEIQKFYSDHLESHKTSSYKEFPICKKNGDIVWVGQYVTTIFSAGSNKEITGFIALARDITEIRQQQELIREQRDSITSSINYAQRIQYNLLPHNDLFKSEFEEHFIIYKPKDIVSGDFYWMKKVENHTVLVLADCTGHGVPGSFMTLLGFNLLNSIVLEGKTVDPAKILNELDKKLIEYLPKGEGETTVNDGMEVTICVFNDKTNEISYACAGSRFLVYENNSLTMFKGDNKHIGDIENEFNGYNSYFKEFNKSYNLFLFTDGFQDQFGGPKDKKYSFRRLLELFEVNINLPLNEQSRIIEDDFNNWIGDNQQTDDVTILSVTREIVNFTNHEDLP